MKRDIVILFIILLFQNNVDGFSRIDPLVDTKVGLIRGLTAPDGDYSMFMGIPYAKVDEENPFGPSSPYPQFDKVFEAYDDSVVCPQIEEFNNTVVGKIDCLHLNVYVPSSAHSKNRLPVLVWIYGGGFSIGFAGRTLYGPKYLVRHDVILVTLNYRLGPYGFMCLNTPEVPGNQGIKDQLLALRWVKDNIESFGGDFNKITIFGESAGAISVDLHLLSPEEKLFNSIILQSGTAFMSTFQSEANTMTPIRLSERLGFNTTDISEALSFLSTVDPKLVIAATSEADYFGPCIENGISNEDAFIIDYTINLNVPKAKGMQILIGFNEDEMVGLRANEKSDFYETWNEIHKKLSTAFDFEDAVSAELEEIIKHFYIGDQEISEKVKLSLADFESDFQFNYPAERSVDKYIKNEADQVFYYMFSYVGERNWMRWANNISEGGATHADEIGYLFDVSLWKDEPTVEDQRIIDRITTMWTNFVKYGDPTPETTELLPVKWQPITSKDSLHYYLNIDTEMKIETRPYNDRMAFWELFYKLNEIYQKGYKN
ncbi:cholinesterase-like [Pectinophora gossypiella]|uniref:cholinesterase-like n=1 Tax=Pectinophora gossypiella TaxID=13191 RepID=UPI00214EAB36|nr:cholinesterase-like [Pectinophora gossypiella]